MRIRKATTPLCGGGWETTSMSVDMGLSYRFLSLARGSVDTVGSDYGNTLDGLHNFKGRINVNLVTPGNCLNHVLGKIQNEILFGHFRIWNGCPVKNVAIRVANNTQAKGCGFNDVMHSITPFGNKTQNGIA